MILEKIHVNQSKNDPNCNFYVFDSKSLISSINDIMPGDALVCPNAIFFTHSVDGESKQVIVKKNPLLVLSKKEIESSQKGKKVITLMVLSVTMGLLHGIYPADIY